MADTKISALTAASAAAGTNELAINEAGTSKKVTAAQLKTLVNDAPTFAAGSASAGTKPKLTSGTLMTTPEAGALEYDGNVFYATPEAGNRGVWPAEHFIIQTSGRTLANSASEQALFDSVANGALDLAAGTYFFEAMFSLSSMSTTSGNCAFDILGAGTATIGLVHYAAHGVDNNAPTASQTQGGSFSTTAQSAASIVTAGAAAAMFVTIRGMFQVTGAGTIIPSVTLVTAAAASLAAGAYFKCHCVGSSSVASVGDWS